MSSQLAKFDPSTLMQGVKDRIKSEFVSLIPDEQWNEMVQKEINDFFKEKETGYSNRNYASDFSILVRDELKAETKKRLAEYFTSSDFVATWSQYGLPNASKAVQEMMIENSGIIISQFFGGMFQSMLQQYAYNLKNNNHM